MIRVTVCNVPIQLNGDVLAAYLSKYGSVKAITPLKSSDGRVHGDNILTVSLDREGLQAIPNIISCKEQQMIVVIEDRRPIRCAW